MAKKILRRLADSGVKSIDGNAGIANDNFDEVYGLHTQIPELRPLTLTSDAPTITWSATAPASGRRIRCTNENVNVVGCSTIWNDTDNNAGCSGGYSMYGPEFVLNGTSLTFAWKCNVSAAERFMFYINGLPVSLTPATPSVSTVLGTVYYCTLTFGATGVRKISILGTSMNAFAGITVPVTASITKTRNKRRVFVTGDSFIAGSASISSADQLPISALSRLYDCSISAYGYGGSGYTVTGGGSIYGSATRTAIISRFDPHDIVIVGSTNDDANHASVQAAVEACIAAYKAVAPGANITVFGPPPTNHTDTISANRTANNKAVKAGCVAAGVTFVDQIGTATYDAIPAFVSGTTYNPGYVVTHLGAVWRFGNGTALTVSTATGYPGTGLYSRWDLITKYLFGTGSSTNAVGDGSRDMLLYGGADNVHPMPAQCINIAQMIGEQLFSRG